MSIGPGTKLGPYEIQARLGAGGMGEVWLATDTRLGREVAVKVLPAEFAGDAERMARFEQEARSAAALNHPHIAAVFDVGVEYLGDDRTESSAVHYMVQERLVGITLRELLEAPLRLPRALTLATEIAEAVGAAHRAGIVHRDLKPENVFVTEDGHAKVLDFGLAKLTEPGGPGGTDASLSPTMLGTRAGEVMGTAGYMAPEQAQGEVVDHRADLFSLGCVLYEMVAGCQPFAGDNVYETLGKIVSKEPAALDTHAPGLPPELQRIVRKSLSKDPDLRYQSAADVAVDLKLLARDVESGAAAVEVAVDPPEPVAATASIGRTVALVGAAVVLTSLAWWATRPAPAAGPPPRTFSFEYPEAHPVAVSVGRSIAMAPDGSFVAFRAGTPGNFAGALYVRHLDDPVPVLVSDLEGLFVDVSPDSEWLAFIARDEGSHLYKVALAGGAPFRLGAMVGPTRWGDDGVLYVGSSGFNARGVGSRIADSGGEPEEFALQGLPEGASAQNILPLPDARRLVLDVGSGRADDGGLCLFDPSSGQATPLLEEGSNPAWSPTGHLLWTREDVLYAARFDLADFALTGRAVPVLQGVASRFGLSEYALSHDGTLAWIAGRATTVEMSVGRAVGVSLTGEMEELSTRREAFTDIRISPDGLRAAVVLAEVRDDGARERSLWVLDLGRDTYSRVVAGDAWSPAWSADGAWLYFSREADDGDIDLWQRPADFSADAELLLERDGSARAEAATPDGGRLLFVDTPDDEGDGIWVLDLESGEAQPWLSSENFENGPRVSADGRLVAYLSNETGMPQVYVRELDGARRWAVSPGEGRMPVWSRDGLSLFYAAGPRGRRKVARADMTFGEDLRIEPEQLLDGIPDAFSLSLYDITPSGRLVGYLPSVGDDSDTATEADPGRDRIHLWLNWFQELERLVPEER